VLLFKFLLQKAGLRKTRFFFKKKTTHLGFLFFLLKKVFFCFFKKKQDFVLCLKKMEKPYS